MLNNAYPLLSQIVYIHDVLCTFFITYLIPLSYRKALPSLESRIKRTISRQLIVMPSHYYRSAAECQDPRLARIEALICEGQSARVPSYELEELEDNLYASYDLQVGMEYARRNEREQREWDADFQERWTRELDYPFDRVEETRHAAAEARLNRYERFQRQRRREERDEARTEARQYRTEQLRNRLMGIPAPRPRRAANHGREPAYRAFDRLQARLNRAIFLEDREERNLAEDEIFALHEYLEPVTRDWEQEREAEWRRNLPERTRLAVEEAERLQNVRTQSQSAHEVAHPLRQHNLQEVPQWFVAGQEQTGVEGNTMTMLERWQAHLGTVDANLEAMLSRDASLRPLGQVNALFSIPEPNLAVNTQQRAVEEQNAPNEHIQWRLPLVEDQGSRNVRDQHAGQERSENGEQSIDIQSADRDWLERRREVSDNHSRLMTLAQANVEARLNLEAHLTPEEREARNPLLQRPQVEGDYGSDIPAWFIARQRSLGVAENAIGIIRRHWRNYERLMREEYINIRRAERAQDLQVNPSPQVQTNEQPIIAAEPSTHVDTPQEAVEEHGARNERNIPGGTIDPFARNLEILMRSAAALREIRDNGPNQASALNTLAALRSDVRLFADGRSFADRISTMRSQTTAQPDAPALDRMAPSSTLHLPHRIEKEEFYADIDYEFEERTFWWEATQRATDLRDEASAAGNSALVERFEAMLRSQATASQYPYSLTHAERRQRRWDEELARMRSQRDYELLAAAHEPYERPQENEAAEDYVQRVHINSFTSLFYEHPQDWVAVEEIEYRDLVTSGNNGMETLGDGVLADNEEAIDSFTSLFRPDPPDPNRELDVDEAYAQRYMYDSD